MSTILNISKMVSIALHSMVIIAAEEENLINVKSIAGILGVSEAHLAKVMQKLVKAGYVRSVRGPKGGFTLALAPETLSLLDIYEVFEGPIQNEGCPMNCQVCAFQTCIFGDMPHRINSEFIKYMQGIKVSDLMKRLKEGL